MDGVSLDWLMERRIHSPYLEFFAVNFGNEVGVEQLVKFLHEDVGLKKEDFESWALSLEVNFTKELIEKGANLHVQRDMPLIFASEYDRPDVAEILLIYGADVHTGGERPFLATATYNCAKTLKVLIRHGANVHVRNDEGFLIAVKYGHNEVVQILLEKGVPEPIKEQALLEAIGVDRQEVVRSIIKSGVNIHANDDALLRSAKEHNNPDMVKILDIK
ncbi:MAG: hypothetical protein PHW72_02100 [Candidatus Pacebacteria bacterium]|nr:hypothetical protein [Candidatus Paceibacterota bacterium]